MDHLSLIGSVGRMAAVLHLPQAKRCRSKVADYWHQIDCDELLHFDLSLHKVRNERALFSGLPREI